jgi:hypothetical protein
MPEVTGTVGQILALDVDNESLIWDTLDTPILFANDSYYTDNTDAPGVGVQNSLFFGLNAGQGTVTADDSNFIGTNAGLDATSISNSNFIGVSAGWLTTNISNANFIGNSAGVGADNASSANFIGLNAGSGATDAFQANFIGEDAGSGATFANRSVFLGFFSGSDATNANDAYFFGSSAGRNATNANNSFFAGIASGENASEANNSIFMGNSAGFNATNASKSIFLGLGAGLNDTVDNTQNANDYSILIGPNSSTGGFSNSIALGRFATNTAINQFLIGSATTPINQTRIIGSASTECTITTGVGIACSSDERIKSNINDLESDILDTLTQVRTVSYNWSEDTNSPTQIGFLAQDLEQYFPQLVTTNESGMKSVYYSQMTPILVQAIRELDLRIDSLFLDEGGFVTQLRTWLGSAENNLEQIIARRFVAQDEICIGETCINEGELQELLDLRMQSDTFIYHSVPTNDTSSLEEGTADQESVPEEITEVSSSEEVVSQENENEVIEYAPAQESEPADDAPTEESVPQESEA